ncbi:tetratricopeptide repeat protein [Actinoplanes sp. NPDC051470]|uniref:tetratricopeptide repeat protein n=1 Tax=unclassified Actinoplanes TaxID=2626549 RepID=UPI00343A3EED
MRRLSPGRARRSRRPSGCWAGGDHPDTLRSGHNLGVGYRETGRHAASAELLTDTLRRSGRVLGIDHPATLRCRAGLAETYQRMGRNQDAETIRAGGWVTA